MGGKPRHPKNPVGVGWGESKLTKRGTVFKSFYKPALKRGKRVSSKESEEIRNRKVMGHHLRMFFSNSLSGLVNWKGAGKEKKKSSREKGSVR